MKEFPRKQRDFLDLLETYKYMNEPVFWETIELSGRWDHGLGWVNLHLPEMEWRIRLAKNLFQSLPEANSK